MSEKFVVPDWWIDLCPEKRRDGAFWGLVSYHLVTRWKRPATATKEDVEHSIAAVKKGGFIE